MNEDDAGPLPGHLEANDVRRQQIHQQGRDQEIPAHEGESARHLPAEKNLRLNPAEPTVKESFLHRPGVGVELRPGADEDQHHRRGQEHDGQLERRKRLENLFDRAMHQ